MKLSITDFGAFHTAVHDGKSPFEWQQRLLAQVVREKCWPRVLDLPTGSGKTTCIDIAIFALALDAEHEPSKRWCPRRIAMVVDRRIVVDQVAERGRTILRALLGSKDKVVVEISRRLRLLTRTGEEPLDVFTLRGGMPKDDGWARTPDQPLVIASTVDQIGSRMLMQGYGVSHGMKPVHAGLVANDTLLLLDEVHLSEPFRQTLDQLAQLRERFSENGVKTRFFHAFLSATPAASEAPPFRLTEKEKKLASPLGPRLHASKPARMFKVAERDELIAECSNQALALLEKHQTIAVVVNRVESASKIARRLSESLGESAIVTLLTGRMRPLDRDDVLRELRPYVQTGRERSATLPRRVIVGTQCIEAGADFDFDALVTEAASLDSLRQRFGRVDRLGLYKRAEGVIVYVKSKKAELDPIYGKSIDETFKWLLKQEEDKEKTLKGELKTLKTDARKLTGEAKQEAEKHIERMLQVDFGILALPVATGDELTDLLSPKQDAPVLLPAYMDLWAQTSPPPSQIPDVSLWLHGSHSGPADVQVIWRADLSKSVLIENDLKTATSIVSAVRPSSLEAISLPFVAARAWLAGEEALDLSDTEGAALDSDVLSELNSHSRRIAIGRPALRWLGDESEIIFAKSASKRSLRPGDTIVVPTEYGGIRNECFDATSREPVIDRAEQAELFARAKPVLRLHPKVYSDLGLSLPLEEPEEVRKSLKEFISNKDWPEWKRLWAKKLSTSRGTLVIPGNPPRIVLVGKRIPIDELRNVLKSDESSENGAELTTDAEDSFYSGRSVSLSEHTQDVETISREFAMSCGLGPWLSAHVALAAWLHDIGKTDRRFQLMLRGGIEIEYYKDETPWAKSAMPHGAREAHRLAQARSHYPNGMRHELQSLAMAEKHLEELRDVLKKIGPRQKPDMDLILHLIASHHGYCRPFVPVVADDTPIDTSLPNHESTTFGKLNFSATTSNHQFYRFDSPLADRFWALIEKYGWLELCWFEAILRLADHRASELEQKKENGT